MRQVSFEQFQALTEVPVLSDELMSRLRGLEKESVELARLRIADRLENSHFSDLGTWATFMGPELIQGDKRRKRDVRAQYEVLGFRLNCEFIIVEMHKAGEFNQQISPDRSLNAWWNFHGNPFLAADNAWDTRIRWNERSSEDQNSGVCLLSKLTHETPLEGSWLTDLWKCITVPNSTTLNDALRGLGSRVRLELVEIMALILRREAEVVGAKRPIWLFSGYDPGKEEHRKAAEVLVGTDTRRVICLPHHSGANRGLDNQGHMSLRRWSEASLEAMLNEIRDVRTRLGLPWNVDAKMQAAAAMPRA